MANIIRGNTFRNIGGDAIRVGRGVEVEISDNLMERIGGMGVNIVDAPAPEAAKPTRRPALKAVGTFSQSVLSSVSASAIARYLGWS